jgi:D-alanyl-D-alanine carboxypeptidase
MSVRYSRWIIVVLLWTSVHAAAQEDFRVHARQAPAGQSPKTWDYVNRTVYPAGRFVILPDNEGRKGFDAALTYALQRALDSVRITQGVAGVSAAVLVPGQGVWQGVSGISSRMPPVNVDPSMLFGIGSNTKAFISATILSLVDEGMLSLDDPLSRRLPSYPNITGSVTIRQLMNMTSGLFDYLNDSNAQGDSVAANPTRRWTPEELIHTFVGPPHGLPGGAYSYCNTDYILLGMVIKNITGMSVSSQIRNRVLTPISLDHTYLAVEESFSEPVAHPWDGGTDFASVPITAHFSTLWTAGGVMSTPENMARWINALYEGKVISPASLSQMLTFVPMTSTVATGFTWNGYGLGVRQGSYYGKRVLGHVGAVMGYVSITGYLPRTGASFAVLFNESEGGTGTALAALFDAYLRKVVTQPALPGVCYAIAGGADSSRIYLADTSTGSLTPVGSPHYGEIVGARMDPRTGTFWGLANAGGWDLVHIDGETGEAYPRVRVTFPTGAPSDFRGLDFSPGGSLYVGSVDGRIYSINTATGIAALAVSTKISISGLAFDPASGALWASIRTNPTLRDRIYKINIATGDTVGAGNTGFNQPLVDLAYDASGNLFGLVGNPTSSLKYRLARINKVTGAGTEIGSVGLAGMVGLAFLTASIGTSVDSHTPVGVAAGFELEQNYPNPFNSSTMISYKVPEAGSGGSGLGSGIVNSQSTVVKPEAGTSSTWVRLSIYDILGREVAVLVNHEEVAGTHQVSFNASTLPSGVYLYRLQIRPLGSSTGSDTRSGAGSFSETRRLILVK